MIAWALGWQSSLFSLLLSVVSQRLWDEGIDAWAEFYEKCPDLRNTKVVDMIRSLERYGMDLEVVDPK